LKASTTLASRQRRKSPSRHVLAATGKTLQEKFQDLHYRMFGRPGYPPTLVAKMAGSSTSTRVLYTIGLGESNSINALGDQEEL